MPYAGLALPQLSFERPFRRYYLVLLEELLDLAGIEIHTLELDNNYALAPPLVVGQASSFVLKLPVDHLLNLPRGLP